MILFGVLLYCRKRRVQHFLAQGRLRHVEVNVKVVERCFHLVVHDGNDGRIDHDGPFTVG